MNRTPPFAVSFIVLIVILVPIFSLAQISDITITKVFEQIVTAYGNAKAAPKLEILKNGNNAPAAYFATPTPTIKIDRKLLVLFQEMGTDSLNAMSVILSHELAHYYNDHSFCNDFAFAIQNTTLSEKIKATKKAERIINETQADNAGLYYASIAGYKPFGVYNRLLDKIYSTYHLPEQMEGYPSKSERKLINEKAQEKIHELYTRFITGVSALKNGKYELAIDVFGDLNKYFPSRENYNNLGTAKTLKALGMKPLDAHEFVYPIEFDPQSRMNQSANNRSLNEQQTIQMQDLLKSAQKDFEKAIQLDPLYTKAFINLACVYDLLGNPLAAIGKIKELPNAEQESKQALQILLIAYYHADMEEKARGILEKIKELK